MLARDMFSESPKVQSFVAELDGKIVGYALFFWTYSTFLTKPGLWMEDLYVTPELRGQGLGQALLNAVIEHAGKVGAGRLEWSVLDWNVNAIQFYEKLGAEVMPDWRICRITDPGNNSA
jgi:GNAT superfamily N-acetyltransferase